MITIEDARGTELTKAQASEISKQTKPLTVGALELALLAQFPREDAEEWDRTGLIVGDPAALVTSVAVALDVTHDAIEAAYRAGANVLLTHHPAFIEPPAVFSPSYAVASAPGVNVYDAIGKGVALMNFHTALDVSVAATRLLAGMLGVDFERILIPVDESGQKGYGQLCAVRPSDAPFRLQHLAARCTSVFGRLPRVWGSASATVKRIVIANGSAGNVIEAAIAVGADCLVCGEVKYHAALDALQAGLCVVELGHDVSELPLCALLAQATIDAGVPSDEVFILDQGSNWSTPDATRI